MAKSQNQSANKPAPANCAGKSAPKKQLKKMYAPAVHSNGRIYLENKNQELIGYYDGKPAELHLYATRDAAQRRAIELAAQFFDRRDKAAPTTAAFKVEI